MTHYLFPEDVKIESFSLNIVPNPRGGSSEYGDSYFTATTGAKWEATLNIADMSFATAFKLRSFLHSLRGSNRPFVIRLPANTKPLVSLFTNPTGLARTAFTDSTTFSDGTTFSDTWSYTGNLAVRQGGGLTSGTANKGATSISIRGAEITNPELLVPGALVMIGGAFNGGQLVRAIDVTGTTPYQVTIEPPLRETVASLSGVQFGAVLAGFRLTDNPPPIVLNPTHAAGLTLELTEYWTERDAPLPVSAIPEISPDPEV